MPFLSFVYRRQSSAPSSFQSSSGPSPTVVSPHRHSRLTRRSSQPANAPRPFLPPGVTSSESSDSAGWVSPGDSSEDEGILSSPFTPEGLMPRKSADSLRRELKLTPRALEPTMKENRLSGVAKILAGIESKPMMANDVSNDHIRARQQYSDDEEDMILPPPVYIQHRQHTFDSSAKSPVVSTSSFYSRSQQDRPVAMSPVLQVGHARTAVGALVALREAANRQTNSVSGSLGSYLPTMDSKDVGKESNKQTTSKKQPFALGVLPPRIDLPTENKDDMEDETEDENLPYMPVNTPVRGYSNEVRRTITEEDDLYASPSSMQLPADQYYQPLSEAARKGMDTSFSSRAGLMGQEKRESYDFDPIQRNSDNTSFSQASSKSSLISLGKVEESDAEGGADYDRDEEEMDGALMARKYRNQQMRKQMLLQQRQQEEELFEEHQDDFEEGDYDDEESVDEDLAAAVRGGSEAIVPFDQDKYAVQETGCVEFDEVLVRRKVRNQRHEKEAFLLDVAARLRDNLELVADIEDAASSTVAAMGSWFVKTPMDHENLMTGFSAEQRNTLLTSIDSILEELQVAQPEEFILSPSKVPTMAVSHDTLTQALLFCRTLIASAIPWAEKSKMVIDLHSDNHRDGSQQLFLWKCLPELHCALGLTAAQSPDTVRGGGTSLFSLPEDSGAETPHTSNVSMATSITSAYSPHRRRMSAQLMRPQLILQQDGLQLRHTVQNVSSLLQKLTLACLQLEALSSEKQGSSAAQTYVRACDEIKKVYLQLLAIKKEDARALAETFYLESQTPTCNLLLTREVSADDEDDPKVAAKTAQVVALASALAPSSFPVQKERRRRDRNAALKAKSILRGAASNNMDRVKLFSPSTEDMCSKGTANEDFEAVPFEFDDLRRQVGSYDRDEEDEDEQRDGPSLDDYGSRDSEESEWSRRMYQNVSLAARSIRSHAKQGGDELRE